MIGTGRTVIEEIFLLPCFAPGRLPRSAYSLAAVLIGFSSVNGR